MNNTLDWFLARRYLASGTGSKFLSLITWIALGGVTLGVMALVVVLSVMNGAQETLRDSILGATPHIYVQQSTSGSLRMDDWEGVAERVMEVPGVISARPFILTQIGILRPGPYAQASDLYGIRTDAGEDASELEQLLAGPEHLGAQQGTLPGIVIGEQLADRMDLYAGDTVQVIAFEAMKPHPMIGFAPETRSMVVLSRVQTGLYDYDVRSSYVTMETLQDMLGLDPDQSSGIYVRVADPWDADTVREGIQERLGGYPYYGQSWLQTNAQLLSALQVEKLAMWIILTLVVVVAAFNIVSTLVMVVADRTREIGILKSMGMTDARIRKVFVLQGFWIGIIGATVGTVLGLAVALLLKRYPIISLPIDVYNLDSLPVSIHAFDVLVIYSVSILLALVATIYPAYQAASLDPVEAIRHE